MEDPSVGTASFGRYRILGRVASGGMAEVFAGCVKGEAGFERVVAVKRLAEALAADEQFVQLFLQEARLAARIRSAHVVQTLDLGRDDDGTPYLVMDLVVGASVAQLAAGASRLDLPVPADVATGILADACRGLHDAHEATARDGSPLGIVHRDVSPQNILVGEDGIARVADFGIARALDTSVESTRDQMRGKLAYFSPEQANGEPIDRRSDIFSLGIVAWELLTGQRLFRSEHPVRTLHRVLQDPIPSASATRPDLPPALVAAIDRALQRDPRHRFPNASDFEHALRDAAAASAMLLQPSRIASFLTTVCAAEVGHIHTLLKTRASWPGDLSLPAQMPVEIVDRSGATLPDIPTTDPLSCEPTTKLARPAPAPPSTPPPPSSPPPAPASDTPKLTRRQLAVALGAAGLLGGAAIIGKRWIRVRSPSHGPADSSVVQAPPPPPSSRQLLRVGATFLTSIPSSHLAPALFWSAVESSPDGRRKASFVRRIPTLENGAARILPGGKFEVRWEVVPGLKWSDGSPLGADDLVMSQRLLPRPHVLDAHRDTDDSAVFVWSDHFAQAVGGFEPFPAPLFEPLIASGGRDAALEFRKTHPTPGLGPYRIADFRIGEHMIVEANPHFAGPPPSLQRIELRCVKDNARLLEQFERGELDMLVPNAITPEQAEDLKARRPDAVHLRPSPQYVLLQPDLAHPRLASIEVRQALLGAIDRVTLSREIFGRIDLVAHSPVLGLDAGVLRTWPFDPRRAASTLARLGLAGASFPLFHGSWPVDVRLALRVREYLAAAGLDIALQQVDRVSDLRRNGHHGGLVLYSLRDAGPDDVAAHFNLPALGADYDRSARHSGFDDWTASLLDREERAIDPQRRAQLKQELWKAFSERLPVLPLLFLLERIVADPALRGWDGSPSQRFGADLERWYFVR
ncbi:MAG TPA: ABC transporter substrate-binding protein [Polyangiaceae bacterium]|nr:ABC transporter substrate-binding protein [Polyangiaceae bacterium]